MDLSNLQPNVAIMVLVAGILEFAKIYLPDNLEPKLLPLISVIFGALLGFANTGGINGIIIGIISGMTASGVYKFASKIGDKVGGNGNGGDAPKVG